jgi:hypothetical protein
VEIKQRLTADEEMMKPGGKLKVLRLFQQIYASY